jgi:hypothetical protein
MRSIPSYLIPVLYPFFPFDLRYSTNSLKASLNFIKHKTHTIEVNVGLSVAETTYVPFRSRSYGREPPAGGCRIVPALQDFQALQFYFTTLSSISQ